MIGTDKWQTWINLGDDNNPDPKAQAKVVGRDGFAHWTAKKIPYQSSRISVSDRHSRILMKTSEASPIDASNASLFFFF